MTRGTIVNQKPVMCIALSTVVSVCATSAQQQGDRKISAKGFNVLEVSFQTQTNAARVSFEFSSDGVSYLPGDVGLPRSWRIFKSISEQGGVTTIRVPAVAGFSLGGGQFCFDHPGDYWIRWHIGDEQDDGKTIKVEQVVSVDSAAPADLEFISRLANTGLCRLLFGDNWFDQFTEMEARYYTAPESRAIKVVSRLLLATREKWVMDILRNAGPKGEIRDAADTLLAMAKELPESSYAPYAAYYAGCCYAAAGIEGALDAVRERQSRGELKDDLEQGRYRAGVLSKDERVNRAYEAFSLAAERGDEYLKPLALYQHGILRGFAFDFDNAERLLSEADRAAPGDTKIHEWAESRKGIAALRKRVADAKARSDKTNSP